MSFSREVRNQLAQLPIEKPCCQHSQLLALTIVSASEARSVNGQPHLVFMLDNAAVARHLFKLGKAIFHQAPTVTSRHGTGHLMHQVAIPVGESGRLPATLRLDQLQEATKKACCRRAFLRGIFMGCGSIVSPSKAYHLEFNASEDVVRWVVDLMEREGIHAKSYHRTAHSDVWTAYLKDSGEIAAFLTLIGAHHALLALEEVRIGKDLVNNVQRVVNCETANLNRTLQSAERQAREVQWLAEHGHLDTVPPDWRQVAEVRLEMPYASLQELGQALNPPMSKSAVNHRLRLLHQLYEQQGGPAEFAEERLTAG
jgi:hypothetical protein